jgi:hypothetical protein
MDTMLTLRQAHRGRWDNTLKHATELLDANPVLGKFLNLAPGARTEPAVAAMLVEKGRDAYMRGIVTESKAGR